MPQTASTMKLTAILANLVTRARVAPDEPQRRTLPNGLRIDVMLRRNDMLLQLSRTSNYPSETEYQTVIRHWPTPAAADKLHRFKYKNRFFLTGGWSDTPPLLPDENQNSPASP